MDLVLVRHGLTALNASRVFMGHRPIPLAPEGRRQVERLAARLRSQSFDRLVTSDLARTLETAAILEPVLGRVAEREPRLREIDVGDAVGLAYDEVARRWPGVLDPRGVERFPGGESFAEVADRAAACLREAAASSAPDDRVLFVVHGGVVRGATARLLGRPLAEMAEVENTSITHLRHVDGTYELLAYGDASHLG